MHRSWSLPAVPVHAPNQRVSPAQRAILACHVAESLVEILSNSQPCYLQINCCSLTGTLFMPNGSMFCSKVPTKSCTLIFPATLRSQNMSSDTYVVHVAGSTINAGYHPLHISRSRLLAWSDLAHPQYRISCCG
jgi:hypothetical protein